ncbi:DnaJ-domain-containing protein [Macrolepiota fuliginosa MF-IS2]|uniref:Diphthamide biosynthesis protein 4 n=1 Tax=Macrolepiota fuliginosa MF-IS2 TaxID=1400762 RepID=A0A9P5X4C5_9AGAR|nr:DnaJ-domain-containing protein [Macrolepiota fuliginosa MF-IS2]
MHNYYEILSVPPSASPTEIKLAYHHLLLKHHPDKNIHSRNAPNIDVVDIALMQEAYTTLAAPSARAEYDASLKKYKEGTKTLGPRPAQIVSLEEFTQLDLEGMDDTWEYPCRCGGSYRISESDMEKGQHLVGCRSCSEVIWAGYEVQEDEANT